MTRSLILMILIALTTLLCFEYNAPQANPWQKKAALETPARMQRLATTPNRVPDWPPRMGKPFPILDLYDHNGETFSLEAFKGKPVLIEVIAMSCAGCQGFAGGNIHGGYRGFAVQANLKSIGEYFERYTKGQSLYSDKLTFIQLIIYNLHLEAPSAEELAAWRIHFNYDTKDNTYVVSGGKALANSASFKMIPGFLLLDEHHTLLFDATGHNPKHNLFKELLPAAKKLLKD